MDAEHGGTQAEEHRRMLKGPLSVLSQYALHEISMDLETDACCLDQRQVGGDSAPDLAWFGFTGARVQKDDGNTLQTIAAQTRPIPWSTTGNGLFALAYAHLARCAGMEHRATAEMRRPPMVRRPQYCASLCRREGHSEQDARLFAPISLFVECICVLETIEMSKDCCLPVPMPSADPTTS